MRYIEKFTEQAIEWEKQYLLSEFDYLELLDYYLVPSIIPAIAEMLDYYGEEAAVDFKRLSDSDRDYMLDYFDTYGADLLSIGYGYHCVRGFYALDSFQEIATPIPGHWHMTDKRRAVINRWSDLYISTRFDAAYISTNLHLDLELKPHDIAAHIIDCRKNAAA